MRDIAVFAVRARPVNEDDERLCSIVARLPNLRIKIFVSPKETTSRSVTDKTLITQADAVAQWQELVNRFSSEQYEIITVAREKKSPVAAVYEYTKDLVNSAVDTTIYCLTQDEDNKRFRGIKGYIEKEHNINCEDQGIEVVLISIGRFATEFIKRHNEIMVQRQSDSVLPPSNPEAISKLFTPGYKAAQVLPVTSTVSGVEVDHSTEQNVRIGKLKLE